MIMGNRFIKLKEVQQLTGLSRSSIYQFIQDGTFPKQIRTGERAVAWIENEIHRWMNDRIAASNLGGTPLCGS
uniref:Phage transcriptional regulator, AlpA (Modular protein) n=1 Tax=Candidatus Nitrotoga fabula TaxID=2182327 RepID=A0A2X0QW30_9PROT|nr:Phage transcriptional regulator, AlpA (modular protein) [Candidatus Nitrotoga fabula]